MEIHFFSSMPYATFHDDFPDITIHENFFAYRGKPGNVLSVQFRQLSFVLRFPKFAAWAGKILRSVPGEMCREDQLAKVIRDVNPDIIHSLETQHAGYLVAQVAKRSESIPYWIHSTWGIDLHYFGDKPGHMERIKEVLGQVDELVVEGERDRELAANMGHRGPLHVFPSVGGGFVINEEELTPPSKRRTLLVKGAQDEIRRGLQAIEGLIRCGDLLHNYRIVLYNSCKVTRELAVKLASETGADLTVLSHVPQEEMINWNRQARVSITINLSDGVPNSMLEAMSVGCFPIQSDTSMGSEWITDQVTGLLVHPEETDAIAGAIRRALTDDAMVDAAAEANISRIRKNLEYTYQKERALGMYLQASLNKDL